MDSFASKYRVPIFFSLPTFRQLINIKFAPEYEVGKRNLTFNFMFKSLHFFNGGSSISQTRSWHFIEFDQNLHQII